MPSSFSRKQSMYMPADMLEELQREAARQDRSMSWLVQQAWKLARDQVRRLPGGDLWSSRCPPEREVSFTMSE